MCVGFSLGNVPGVKLGKGAENGKLLCAFGEGPGSRRGGNGGGERSRGGKTGASGACFAYRKSIFKCLILLQKTTII